MISKELLEAVFNEKITTEISVDYAEIDGVPQEWKVVWCNYKTYPLDYVAHKCKEWALMHDFSIKSLYDFTHTCFASVYGLQKGSYFNVQASTEPEAIFKACQWVLDNKESK